MSKANILESFNHLNNNNNIVCSKNEIDEFLIYGLLFKNKDKFIDRKGNIINIKYIESKCFNMNINLSNLLNISHNEEFKKLYFMTSKTYNKYKEQNLIVKINGNEFYMLYNNDKWLVKIID